jgi:hypothetical protein
MKDVIVLFVPWMLVTVFISGQLIRNSLLLTLVFFLLSIDLSIYPSLARAHFLHTLRPSGCRLHGSRLVGQA